jgi:hypothetical protein
MAFASFTFAAAVPKTEMFRIRGNNISALFVNPNPGCIATSALVDASEQTNQSPGSPKQFAGSVFLRITKVNLCTGETLLDAQGFQLLTDSNFQVSPSLGTAVLNVNTTAFDGISGRIIDVTIALAWTATEGVSNGHSTNHSRFGGITVHSSSSGASRGAQATGQFSALGTNFATLQQAFAFISKFSNGTVMITH